MTTSIPPIATNIMIPKQTRSGGDGDIDTDDQTTSAGADDATGGVFGSSLTESEIGNDTIGARIILHIFSFPIFGTVFARFGWLFLFCFVLFVLNLDSSLRRMATYQFDARSLFSTYQSDSIVG